MTVDPDSPSRHDHRLRVAVHAEFLLDGRSIPCEAQNLSRSGALLVGKLPPTSSETVEFNLKAPSGNLTITLSGRVIRIEPGTEPGVVRIAVSFLELGDARRDELEILLSRVLEAPVGGPLDSLKPGARPQEIKKVLESIPISQRIALASRATTREREFLRTDTNPAVLEALSRNAALTIAEARVLATSAYLITSTIDALANDPRFKADEELRMAIAVHPKVSVATAEKVTADLKLPQIKLLLARPGMTQQLRDKLFRRTTRS